MYLNARVNTDIFTTTRCTIGEAFSEITLTIEPKYFHALGAIHGSVYFKLLDDAAFFAANSLVEDVFVLTSSFNINFLKPVNSGVIKAKGQVNFNSSKLLVAKSSLCNQDGEEIAFGTGNFIRSKTPLSPEIGYQ